MGRAVFLLTPLFLVATACKEAPARAPEGAEPAAAPAPVAANAASNADPQPSAARPADCPPFSRWARIASQPIVDGAEVVFWTSDDTAMLRRRVSTLSLPSVAQSADFRTDNIHNGIRLVFVSDKPADIVPIRLAVHDYAKQIAARCGVTYAPPKTPKTPKKRSDPTSAASAPPSTKPAATSKPSTSAAPKQVKPAPVPSAAPAAPKPTPAPATSVKKPAGPISDPFAPPPPARPAPPSNPFK